jgi:hypothetical protein
VITNLYLQHMMRWTPKEGPALPVLLLLPFELIKQVAGEFRLFSLKFKLLIYYGDRKLNHLLTFPKINKLKRSSSVFNGAAENRFTVIISTTGTMRERHGPAKLRDHRLKRGWTAEAAEKAMSIPDRTWADDLAGCFHTVVVDEAHTLKHSESHSNITVRWLDAKFHILSTASVLPNGIKDWAGLMRFVDSGEDHWTAENMAKWNINGDFNPYTAGDNHPAAVLCLTNRASQRYITGEDADEDIGAIYVSRIWEKCLIRRTYYSPDPVNPTKRIGEGLAKLHSRHIVCRFLEAEKAEYEKFEKIERKKLIKVLEDSSVVWNRLSLRNLTLLLTWTGFEYINGEMRADTISHWKAKKNMLFEIVKLLHTKQTECHGGASFQLSAPDDVPRLLEIVCRGAPKLRHTLRIVAEVVVLKKRKLLIWASLPANQLLLYACMQALKIDAICYTSELDRDQREKAVGEFTKNPNSAMVFIGGFFVGAAGLNLQGLCSIMIFFDSAPNKGIADQAVARLRRLNQQSTVMKLELSVEGAFQDRIIQKNLRRAMTGILAEVDTNTGDATEDGKAVYNIGEWYWVAEQLVEAGDPRLEGLKGLRRLTPRQLSQAILLSEAGARETDINYADNAE